LAGRKDERLSGGTNSLLLRGVPDLIDQRAVGSEENEKSAQFVSAFAENRRVAHFVDRELMRIP